MHILKAIVLFSLVEILDSTAEFRDQNSLQPPEDGGGDADCARDVFGVAIEAGGDTAPVLEATIHALNDVALLLERFPTKLDHRD